MGKLADHQISGVTHPDSLVQALLPQSESEGAADQIVIPHLIPPIPVLLIPSTLGWLGTIPWHSTTFMP